MQHEDSLRNLYSALETLKKQLSELQSEKVNLERAIVAKTEKVRVLNQRAEQCATENQVLQSELSEFKVVNQSLRSKIDRLSNEINFLEREVQGLKEQITFLNSVIQENETSSSAKDQLIIEIQDKITVLEGQVMGKQELQA